MKKYARYKDSGISWIGDVPEHWNYYPFYALFEQKSQCGFCDEELLSVYLDKGVIRFSDAGEKRANATSEDLSKYQLVEEGDFVLNNQQAWRGSVGVSFFRGIVSPAYVILKMSEKLERTFANYLLRNRSMVAMYCLASKGVGSIQRNLVWNKVKRSAIFIPPLPEQKAIAEYLDKKTAQINELVSAKQKQIELLKEYKQSVIANAVTGKLDERTGSRPTDERREKINWIGYIPRHWLKRKFQYLFKERSEKNHPEEPVLCATQSRGVIPQSMYENRVVVVNTGFEGLKFVKKGDFVISLRSFQGGIEYAYYQGIISAAYTILYINTKDLYSDYVRLLFKSVPFIGLLQTCVTGIREGQNINNDLLRKQIIPIPPLSEQKEIVAYIEKKVSSIDSQIASIENQIANLNEYKQSLISDVVTGKVKV